MEKTRYSDDELQEFKDIILKKLASSREEFTTLQKSLKDGNENGTDSTNNNYLTLDDGADTFERKHHAAGRPFDEIYSKPGSCFGSN